MLAHRYARREGGYTRIHKFGNRPGDNAPHAILELVDNPKDLRFDMTARAIGWELLGSKMMRGKKNIVDTGVEGVETIVRKEKDPEVDRLGFLKHGLGGRLRRNTQNNLQKVLKFRGEAGVKDMVTRAEKYIVRVIFLLLPSFQLTREPGSTRRGTRGSCGSAEICRGEGQTGRTPLYI